MGLKPVNTSIIWVSIYGVHRRDDLITLPLPWFGAVICRQVTSDRYEFDNGQKRCIVELHGYYISVRAAVKDPVTLIWWDFFNVESNFYIPLVPGCADSYIQDPTEPYCTGIATWWYGNEAGTEGAADDIRAALGIPDDGRTYFDLSGSAGTPSLRMARADRSGTIYIRTKEIL